MAHEHWVNAPIAGGTIDADGARPAVSFTVDARRLSVRPEKGSLTKTAPRCNPICRPGSWNQMPILRSHPAQQESGKRATASGT